MSESSAATSPSGRDVPELLQALESAGYDDVLWLRPENVREILTEKRLEIIDLLADEGDSVNSMRDVARKLDRHISVVKEDLDVLAQHGVVEYETEGRRKNPALAHPHVFVQPLLINGEFQREEIEQIDTPG
jgi:predicted transcriptional regulator